MALPAHHPFVACRQLEYEVAQLARVGAVAPAIIEECERWHKTVIFKLNCADHYLEEMVKYIDVASAEMGKGIAPDLVDVNRTLDAFLACSFSGQDVLGRDLDFLFGNPMAGRVRYNLIAVLRDFRRLVTQKPAIAVVTNVLASALDRNASPLPPLLDIRDYRNTSTHALLVPTSEMTVSSGATGASAAGKLYLPDTGNAPTCTGIRELGPTCHDWFRGELGVFDDVFAALTAQIQAHRTIPIP